MKGLKFYRFYKIIGWVSITFASLLCLLRLLTPLLTPSGPQLSAWIAKQLQYPTHIQELKFNWEGLSPAVMLSGVEILSEKNTPLLNIGKIKLRLNVFQLLFARLQLDELIIENATLGIEYQNGHLRVSNLPQLDLNLQDLSASSHQQARFTRLIIEDSAIDLTMDGKVISLQQAELAIEAATVLKIRGAANIVGKKEGHIQIGANVPLLGNKEAQLYLHLQDVDLQEYKHFLPVMPITLQKGEIDLEAWLKIKDQHSIELTSRFKFKDLALKNKEGEIKSLNLIGGDLIAKLEDKQWKITGKKWQFSPETEEKAHEMNFIVDSSFNDEGRLWELKAQHVNVGLLSLATEIALPSSEFVRKLKVHRPNGQLDYLHLAFLIQKHEQKFVPKILDVTFTDLYMEADNKLPGFSGLSGMLTLEGQNAKMLLQSEYLKLYYPALYSYPIEITDLVTVLHGQLLEDSIVIQAETLEANLFDTPFSGQGTWQFKEKTKPHIEMALHLGEMKTATALTLLPRQIMDADLISWLDNALLAGNVPSTTCVLRGNLADFPFDNAEGVFEIYTELENAHLDYTKGWPALADLKANLLFRNRALYILAESGSVVSIPETNQVGFLHHAEAVIPDLAADLPQLIVDAKIASTLDKGYTVIQKSPLEASLGKTLAPLRFEGDMALSLGLEVPLSIKEEHKVKVRGLIEVEQAKVDVTQWNLAATDLQGSVSFTENSVKSDALAGKLLGKPTLFSIENAISNEHVEVKAQGRINLEQLQKQFRLQDIPQIKGETDYNAQLVVATDNMNQASLTVSSNLQGIAIDAPYPLAKQAENEHPFECRVDFDPNELMHFSVKYGEDINLAYSVVQRHKAWQPIGGHIHFGENHLAKHRSDQVLLVDGEIKALDFEQWKTFLSSTAFFLPVAQSGTTSLSLEPLVELNIEDFTLYGFSFPKEKIEARWEGKTHQWNINFAGQAFSGHVIFPQEKDQLIVINLQKLALTKAIDLPEFSSSEETSSKNPLEVKIKELTLNNKVFTDIQTRLEPSWKGYFTPDFKAKMKNTDISLTGSWDYLSSNKKVVAEGKIETKNVTDTLNALGITGSLRNAKGTIGFSVQWNGTPGKIDFASLNGQADLALSRGMINGVNPGIGRVLSLLNLDNVHRRLNLDFSDVTKGGLVFDELDGKFKFGKGKISSNKVMLKSPTVKIEAFGQADLENQALDGEMIVMPDLTGSLPVAAAIASANPAVGAAVWVVDKVLGNKIQQIHRLRYKVLGTWQSPLVEEVPIMTARRG